MQGVSGLLNMLNGICILDGGMSTGLESMGANLNSSLWTAKCLMKDPNLIKEAHKRFYLAGSNIAISASY